VSGAKESVRTRAVLDERSASLFADRPSFLPPLGSDHSDQSIVLEEEDERALDAAWAKVAARRTREREKPAATPQSASPKRTRRAVA